MQTEDLTTEVLKLKKEVHELRVRVRFLENILHEEITRVEWFVSKDISRRTVHNKLVEFHKQDSSRIENEAKVYD